MQKEQDKSKEQLAAELHVYKNFYTYLVDCYDSKNPFGKVYDHTAFLEDLYETLRSRGFELEHAIKRIELISRLDDKNYF